MAPAHLHEEFWGHKDYTTITPATLSDVVARRVLSREMRPRLLERTRGIIRANLPAITGWLDERGDMFSYRAPDAGAICYVRYDLDINSTQLAERLRAEKSVLVVPGDHFGMDHYLRVGFGNPAAELEEGARAGGGTARRGVCGGRLRNPRAWCDRSRGQAHR